MKITVSKYDTMAAAVKAVVEYAGGPAKIKAAYAALTEKRLIWDLWHAASANILYDDAHPKFALGMCSRVYPHNPNFDLWSEPGLREICLSNPGRANSAESKHGLTSPQSVV